MKKLSIVVLLMLNAVMLMCGGYKNGGYTGVWIKSEALAGNIVEFNGQKEIMIYLPEEYDNSQERYPVVYFLAGYGDTARSFAAWTAADRALNNGAKSGKLKKMIVVVLDGKYKRDGSFYVTNEVVGDWEGYITREIVSYMDTNFRTIADRNHRGIAGHSMGGFGALNIAMKYPETFGSVYSLSPGLLDENGDIDAWFSNYRIGRHIRQIETYKGQELEKSIGDFKKLNGDIEFETAYGMAAAPATQFPYYEYPYASENNGITRNEKIADKWKSVFGNLKEKAKIYKDNFLSLHGIALDVGLQDNYPWITKGTVYFNKILTENNIPNILNTYKGDHGNKIPERVREYMLPFFNELFYGKQE